MPKYKKNNGKSAAKIPLFVAKQEKNKVQRLFVLLRSKVNF